MFYRLQHACVLLAPEHHMSHITHSQCRFKYPTLESLCQQALLSNSVLVSANCITNSSTPHPLLWNLVAHLCWYGDLLGLIPSPGPGCRSLLWSGIPLVGGSTLVGVLHRRDRLGLRRGVLAWRTTRRSHTHWGSTCIGGSLLRHSSGCGQTTLPQSLPKFGALGTPCTGGC